LTPILPESTMRSMRFPKTLFPAALLVLAGFFVPMGSRVRGAEEFNNPKTFIYVLRLAPRFQNETAWTKENHAVAQRHFERLKAAAEHGPVILAGRTEEAADKTFGIVIFEAPDEKAARVFMENDPAVKSGLMTAELNPYLIAVQRSAQPMTR